MANTLGSRPMILDTAGATVLRQEQTKINTVVWEGYTADAATFELRNRKGERIAGGNGNSDLSPVEVAVYSWVDGLQLQTLHSGRLIIYVE